ncbi:mucin-7-like [Nycticebus coucang]|uniref:mucin-7-like n=1 Tax=Nycticebus coucang TaxID=9470 RepID=UPI00234DD0F8|nr:mucin-7-like [Nycticebus coucang]
MQQGQFIACEDINRLSNALFLTRSPAPRDSEPSTLDSQSSTTLFLSSEEPGPSTAALPSPSSSCEAPAFSPGPAVLPPLPAAAPPGPGAPRRAGLYSVVASSPEAAPRLVDWLPGCPAASSPGARGDERERPPPVLAPVQGRERGRAAGREQGAKDPGASPPPRVLPAAAASLEANVGDILVELRTMNGHLDVIARALTKLASSLGPQPQPLPDTPDAN